jgi:hypothetical protein
VADVDALTQLKDIHLPEAIGWWPLAPGWYVLIAVALMAVWYSADRLYKRHVHARAKKQALLLLQTYTAQYEQDHNAQLTSARISELLKRVALAYFPREQVASTYGQAWIDFLNKTGKGVDFEPVKSMLLDSPFKTKESLNLKPLITRAQLWIKQRKAPCSN